MTAADPIVPALIEWGAAAKAIVGEKESGDAYLVQPFEKGVLVAVIDGLGHGREAAEASRVAASVLVAHASVDLEALIRQCNEALRRTRGVVMSVACFSESGHTVSWAGVGNVEGLLWRTARPIETIVLRGGVVGYQLPAIRPATHKVSRGDVLIFATDGIQSAFRHNFSADGPIQQIADDILLQYRKKTDDALVLVVRYLGESL